VGPHAWVWSSFPAARLLPRVLAHQVKKLRKKR
jgi:hypothetical protein